MMPYETLESNHHPVGRISRGTRRDLTFKDETDAHRHITLRKCPTAPLRHILGDLFQSSFLTSVWRHRPHAPNALFRASLACA